MYLVFIKSRIEKRSVILHLDQINIFLDQGNLKPNDI
jgi:hypothetical protein